MPLPVKMEPGPGKLAIDGSFTAGSTGAADARLEAALLRCAADIGRQTGIPMLHPQAADPARATLQASISQAGAEYPTLGEDESYRLDVTPDGARLSAATVDGALRGLATFEQLIVPGADGFQVAAVHIEDRPRFPWRGLMLDVSRHWMPIDVVLRNLDAMATVKLNVFHWHLSDDQGFRVESKRFPKLQEMGSDGHYYTQDQVRQVIEYARLRGIRVVPEFDIPGHTVSWFPGYPELASVPGPFEIGRHWGIYDPVMDPTRESTYRFLDAFIGEMAHLFPDSYFHIGGDEVNGKAWRQNEAIAQFAREHHLDIPNGLQTYFNQRVEKIVEKYGKIMVGWDEIVNPDLPAAAVIQSWRGNAALAKAAADGHRAILSWGYYLDHLSPASYHYGIDPLGGPAAQLSPDEAARILGGEACMWDEYADAETVDSRIWPRMAAIAERFWSPKDVTDVASMYDRLEQVSRRLDFTGIRHRADYAPMLARLAGERPDAPLRTLADACEALGLGGPGSRSRARVYTSLVPLNRLVDAARPESELVRHLEAAATRHSAPDLALLREQFQIWAANDTRFQKLADEDYFLDELRPLSRDLSELGTIGLKVLDDLAQNQPPSPDWLSAQTAELARIAKPQAEVRLAAVRPVKLLLDSFAAGAK